MSRSSRLDPDRLVKFTSEFIHTGINGRHQCLVFEPMGLTASWLILGNDHLARVNDRYENRHETQRYSWAKSVLKDLLLSLHNLHSCGVASGDLHPKNVMATLKMRLNGQSVPLLIEHPTQDNIVQHVIRDDRLPDPWAPNYITRQLPLREVTEADSPQQMKLGGLQGGRSHAICDAS
jgi:non-specific serine/threonine protein kinase